MIGTNMIYLSNLKSQKQEKFPFDIIRIGMSMSFATKSREAFRRKMEIVCMPFIFVCDGPLPLPMGQLIESEFQARFIWTFKQCPFWILIALKTQKAHARIFIPANLSEASIVSSLHHQSKPSLFLEGV